MKTSSLFLSVVLIFSAFPLFSQEGIRHQGVLRQSGNLMSNQNIGVQYLIRQGGPMGTMVFNETANLTTNTYGLFSHTVGSINTAQFGTINWGLSDYFLEVIVNGTNFGTTEITKVPKAYHADHVGSLDDKNLGDLGDVSGPAPTPGQALIYNGSSWAPDSIGLRLPIAWGWIQTGSLNYEGFGIASVSSSTTGEYVITLSSNVNGYPCIVATAFTRTGASEITGYSANSGSNIITVKVFDGANPSTLKNSDFSFIVYDN